MFSPGPVQLMIALYIVSLLFALLLLMIILKFYR